MIVSMLLIIVGTILIFTIQNSHADKKRIAELSQAIEYYYGKKEVHKLVQGLSEEKLLKERHEEELTEWDEKFYGPKQNKEVTTVNFGSYLPGNRVRHAGKISK